MTRLRGCKRGQINGFRSQDLTRITGDTYVSTRTADTQRIEARRSQIHEGDRRHNDMDISFIMIDSNLKDLILPRTLGRVRLTIGTFRSSQIHSQRLEPHGGVICRSAPVSLPREALQDPIGDRPPNLVDAVIQSFMRRSPALRKEANTTPGSALSSFLYSQERDIPA